jgi:hypothetical protein
MNASSTGNRAEVIFHLAQLDFSRLVTLRQPPAIKASLLLADEILTSGFVTNGDPIMVHLLDDLRSTVPGPWPPEMGSSRAFVFGYVKGANRMCTLHTLITLCLDDDISIEQAGQGEWMDGVAAAAAVCYVAVSHTLTLKSPCL